MSVDPTAAGRLVRAAAFALAPVLVLLHVAPAHATGLVDVYRSAVEYDSAIAASRDELDAASLNVPIARSALLPQLAASAGYSLEWIETDEGSDDFDGNQWGLQLSQNLWNPVNSALLAQAGVGVSRAEAEFANASEQLLLRAASGYFDVLRAAANVEFARSDLEAIRRQREQAERRFDVGLVSITDVRTAQAEFDLATAQEIAASDALATAREALRTLAGFEVDELEPLAPDLPLAPPDPADPEAWVALAIEQNVELVIARYAADGAGAQIDVERAARLPSLDIVADGGAARSAQALRPTDARTAQIGIQATLPLYTGGRIGARVAQARAQRDAAVNRLRGAERSASQRARDGYRGVLAAIARVRALEQALGSTRRSAEAVESGFRAGTRTSVDVLRAQRDVFRARTDYAGARYDYVLSSLQLQSAAGTLGEADLEAIEGFLVPPR